MLKIKNQRCLTIFIAALVTLSLVLSGCGSKTEAPKSGSDSSAATVLKVGATPIPHAEILEFVKPALKKEGIDLQIGDNRI